MATASISTEEKVEFTIAPKTSAGSDASVEGFTVDLKGADLTYDFDEATKTGHIISGSTAGTFDIEFRGDKLIGEGEEFISEQHQITVTSASANTLTGTFGAVTPKA